MSKKEIIESLVLEVRESLGAKGVFETRRTEQVIAEVVLCDEKYAELYSHFAGMFDELERTKLAYVKDQLVGNLYYRMHSVLVHCVKTWSYNDFESMVRSQLRRTVNGRIIDSVEHGFEATSYERTKEIAMKDALDEEAVEVNHGENIELDELVAKYIKLLPASRRTDKLRPRSEFVLRRFLSGEDNVKEIGYDLADAFDIPSETGRTFVQQMKRYLKEAIGGGE